MILHEGARYVGLGWMVVGLALYVVYRRSRGQVAAAARRPCPSAALRARASSAEYGSILVPIFGTPLDDDIVQTAGRLAADEPPTRPRATGATIEALWVFEVPMSLPIDARLPEAQLEHARAALRRAKAVGEEYDGRRGRDGDGAHPPRRPGDRRGGAAPRRRGDRARRRGAVADPRRRAARRPRRAARELRRRRHQVRASARPPCRVILTRAGRASDAARAARGRAEGTRIVAARR